MQTLFAIRTTHSTADVLEWWGVSRDALLSFAKQQGGVLSAVVPFEYAGEFPSINDDYNSDVYDRIMDAAAEALYVTLGEIPEYDTQGEAVA